MLVWTKLQASLSQRSGDPCGRQAPRYGIRKISMQLEMEPTVPRQPRQPRSPHRQGLLFVLSAPSGTGKDTIIGMLKQQGMDFYLVASVTTRAARPGESEGNPYHFVSQGEFDRLVAHDELLEYANVHGNWYGQPRRPIRDNLLAK